MVLDHSEKMLELLQFTEGGIRITGICVGGNKYYWNLRRGEYVLLEFIEGEYVLLEFTEGEYVLLEFTEGNTYYWNLRRGEYVLLEFTEGGIHIAGIYGGGIRITGIYGGEYVLLEFTEGGIHITGIYGGRNTYYWNLRRGNTYYWNLRRGGYVLLVRWSGQIVNRWIFIRRRIKSESGLRSGTTNTGGEFRSGDSMFLM